MGKPIKKTSVKVLKDVYGLKKGDIVEVSPLLARMGVNSGTFSFADKDVKQKK